MQGGRENRVLSALPCWVHFADKEDLFHQLCQEDFARLAEVFQTDTSPSETVERMQEVGRLDVEFGIRYPNHYKPTFMTAHPASEPGPGSTAK